MLAESRTAHVEAGVHLHHANTGHFIAGEQGALNRRSAAPARQQGSVNVDAAKTRQVKNRLRQNQAVSGDDHRIGVERA